MKLSREQITNVTENLDFNVIGDDHEVKPQLESILGEHTFFINDNGLFVFVPCNDNASEAKTARLLIVAAWANDKKDQLAPLKEPKELDVLFDLEAGEITGGN